MNANAKRNAGAAASFLIPRIPPLLVGNGAGGTAEDEVYRYLLAAICSGQYAAGQRLKSEEIALAVGMSRMPVREAFRRLAAEGLLTMRPNRGVVVTGLDAAAMQEIFEMRSVLEGLAARLSVPQLTERHLAALQSLLDEMDECRDDTAQWVILHRQFHELVSGLSERPRLLRQISSLHAAIEPYMHLWMSHARKERNAKDAHDFVMAALRSRDPGRAEQALREHVLMTVAPLLVFMRRKEHEQDWATGTGE